jgi:hypothetical protein
MQADDDRKAALIDFTNHRPSANSHDLRNNQA